jgi:hypothetical protein
MLALVSAWLAALNVRYRDVRYAIPFLFSLAVCIAGDLSSQHCAAEVEMALAVNP